MTIASRAMFTPTGSIPTLADLVKGFATRLSGAISEPTLSTDFGWRSIENEPSSDYRLILATASSPASTLLPFSKSTVIPPKKPTRVTTPRVPFGTATKNAPSMSLVAITLSPTCTRHLLPTVDVHIIQHHKVQLLELMTHDHGSSFWCAHLAGHTKLRPRAHAW